METLEGSHFYEHDFWLNEPFQQLIFPYLSMFYPTIHPLSHDIYARNGNTTSHEKFAHEKFVRCKNFYTTSTPPTEQSLRA